MAADRTQTGAPLAELPEITGRTRPPRDQQIPGTLAGYLVPSVDTIRSIYARFGVHVYRVHLVHVLWSGDRKGEGVAQIISYREILPVPRVRGLDQVTETLRFAGLTEEGAIVVDRISARYTEDDLRGYTPDLQNPALLRTSKQNVDFFWEVRESRPSTPTPQLRRFAPVTAMVFRDQFQWTVGLVRQDNDRGRSGATIPRSAF